MTFTYRSVKGALLTAAEVDANFYEVESLHDDVVTYKNAAAASAAEASGYADNSEASALEAAASEDVAVAAANYEGNWSAQAYTVPASVTHLGAMWILNTNAADTDVPGTSDKWTFWRLTDYRIDIQPTLVLNFEEDVYKSYVPGSEMVEWDLNGVDTKITFTRATTATYFDPMGVLREAASGVPRIDHDPATGECLGLLVEEQRTNLLTYSEQFDNAAWTKSNATITANATTAPDGTLTAEKIVPNTANATHYVNPTSTVSGSSSYTMSVFAKTGEGIGIQLLGDSNLFDTIPAARFNLVTHDITNTINVDSYGVQDVGNGWVHCWISATTKASPTAGGFSILIMNAANQSTYTGDGTSGLYLWGAQLEEGAFPTSYIPTTTAAVTRNADVVSMTGTDFSDWYNQSEGAVFAEWSRVVVPSSTTVNSVFHISNGSTSYIECISGYANPQQQRIDIRIDDVPQAAMSLTGGVTANTFYKTAMAYKTDDISASFDGDAVVTDSSANIPTTNILQIGYRASAATLTTHIKQIQYYPRRLTNAQLITLST